MYGYYFKLALKGLWRTPWLALLMVVTLAVGLSASMVVSTLRHVLAMDPIPGKSERLLQLQDPAITAMFPGMGGWFTYAEAEQLRRLGGSIASSVETGYGFANSISVGNGSNPRTRVLAVRYATSNFFQTFDVPLVSGRTWTREEEQDAAPVVVIDQDLAGELFPHASPIGQPMRIGDTSFTVVGVSAPWFPQPHYIDLSMGAYGTGGQGVFVPITAIRYAPATMQILQSTPRSHPQPCAPVELLATPCNWLSVWYLAPAESDVVALKRSIESRLPEIFPARKSQALHLFNVRQILANVVPAEVTRMNWLGWVFLLLCIANASGMQLSRLMRSTMQIGVRRALGASQMDIVRQYLCDALLVGGIGGILGVGLTFGGLHVVRHLSFDDVFYTSLAAMDGSMFAAMVGLIFLCGLLSGVLPAWLASRADPALTIKVAP